MNYEEAYKKLVELVEKEQGHKLHKFVPAKHHLHTCRECFLPEEHSLHCVL